MIKYLAGKYYYLLLGCLIFFAINHLIVDTLLDWIYHKPLLDLFYQIQITKRKFLFKI